MLVMNAPGNLLYLVALTAVSVLAVHSRASVLQSGSVGCCIWPASRALRPGNKNGPQSNFVQGCLGNCYACSHALLSCARIQLAGQPCAIFPARLAVHRYVWSSSKAPSHRLLMKMCRQHVQLDCLCLCNVCMVLRMSRECQSLTRSPSAGHLQVRKLQPSMVEHSLIHIKNNLYVVPYIRFKQPRPEAWRASVTSNVAPRASCPCCAGPLPADASSSSALSNSMKVQNR